MRKAGFATLVGGLLAVSVACSGSGDEKSSTTDQPTDTVATAVTSVGATTTTAVIAAPVTDPALAGDTTAVVVDPTPVAVTDAPPVPVALTTCEGLDTTLADTAVAIVDTKCAWPWALIAFTEPQPRVSIGVVTNEGGSQRMITAFTDVEDGPGVSGYTVAELIGLGMAGDVAQLLYDNLDPGVPVDGVTPSPGDAGAPRWPYASYFDVPQLGTEPVRGSGCGGDGSLGDTIPDGLWAGYIRSIGSATIELDVVCVYFGASATPFVEACEAEQGEDNSCREFSDYFTINNNERTRTVPLADSYVHHTAEWGDDGCQDIGIAATASQYSNLWEVIDSWVRIENGRAVFALTSCPYG